MIGSKRPQRVINGESNIEASCNFSYEQKAAILCVLTIIAEADGPSKPNENSFIEQVEIFFGITLQDPVDPGIIAGGFEELLRILNSLDNSQKEWFILTTYLLIISDDKIDEVVANYSLNFAESIGISEEKYCQIIQRGFFIMRQFI